MDGRRVRGLAAGGAVRIVECDVLGPALHTAAIHGLAPAAAALAAEGLAAAVVLGASLKGDDRLTLQVQSERPELALYVEVRGDGSVRARLTPARIPAEERHALHGLVLVIRANAEGEVWRGMTELRGESLVRALNRHLAESDQVDATLHVAIAAADDGVLEEAAGRLVERLPDEPGRPSIDREAFAALDHAALALDEALDDAPVVWRCACSRERVSAMLAGLGPEELRSMIEEDHGAEVTCHFCRTAYRFDAPALEALAAGG